MLLPGAAIDTQSPQLDTLTDASEILLCKIGPGDETNKTQTKTGAGGERANVQATADRVTPVDLRKTSAEGNFKPSACSLTRQTNQGNGGFLTSRAMSGAIKADNWVGSKIHYDTVSADIDTRL